MIVVELHLNRSRVSSGVGGIERRKIWNDAEVRHDQLQIFGSDFLANQVFHLSDVLIRDLDSASGWNLEVDGELARVRLRE